MLWLPSCVAWWRAWLWDVDDREQKKKKSICSHSICDGCRWGSGRELWSEVCGRGADCQETDGGSDGLISPGPRQKDRQAGRFEPGSAVRVELQARGPDRQRWNVTPGRSAQTAHHHQRGRQTLVHHLYGNASSAATTVMSWRRCFCLGLPSQTQEMKSPHTGPADIRASSKVVSRSHTFTELKVWNPWQLSLAKARLWGHLTDMSNNQS